MLVLGLGVAAGFSLLTPPEGTSAGRQPASFGSTQTPDGLGLQVAAAKETTDFNLPCKGDNHFSFDSKIHQIRLLGQLCRDQFKKEFTNSEVVNLSNGFVATVFPGKLGHFTTDYISLEKGLNHIVVRNRLASGHIENRDYLLERAP